jgi:hypothetical protein
MIDEADRDGDGEISEEEFMRIMKKTNLFWRSGDEKYKDWKGRNAQ